MAHDRSGRSAWDAAREVTAAALTGVTVAPSLFDGVDAEDLTRTALQHGVGALVADALTTGGSPAPEALARESAVGAARHLRSLADLDRIRSVLDGARVGWLVAKGPVLASTWFDRPYLRAYDDLDVYVAPTDFRAAVEALGAAGGVLLDSEEFLTEVMPGEVRVRVATDAVVDLHWRPFFYQVHADRFPVGVADLLATARTWPSPDGTDVLVPARADGLVHLCLHASISGAGRLSWLVDVDRYLLAWPVDPADLRDAVRRWHAGLAVALVLARTAAVLGSVPARRLLATLPGSVRVPALRAERWSGRGPVDAGSRPALARAAGGSVLDTVAWSARAGTRRVLPLGRARRAVPVGAGDYLSRVESAAGGGSSSTSS